MKLDIDVIIWEDHCHYTNTDIKAHAEMDLIENICVGAIIYEDSEILKIAHKWRNRHELSTQDEIIVISKHAVVKRIELGIINTEGESFVIRADAPKIVGAKKRNKK